MKELLRLEHISKEFSLGRGRKVAALKDISLTVHHGETLGIVGESGCGKSTLAKTIMGVYPPTAGKIYYEGQELCLKRQKERLAFSAKVQMTFQDPFSSLDPRMTAAAAIGENLELHGMHSREERGARTKALLEMVGLEESHGKRFPYEFSGGQRQRIGIARALANGADFLICDEPISALDVSIQSQIMNLLERLKGERGLTYLFIAHDLPMVRYISDRIAVMYQGAIVEIADSEALMEEPQHPYTRMLLEAVLSLAPNQDRIKNTAKRGDMTSFVGTGCAFASGCPRVQEKCRKEVPSLSEKSRGHWVACFA